MKNNFALIKNDNPPAPKPKCSACGHGKHEGVCREPVRVHGKLFSHEACGCHSHELTLKNPFKMAA